MRTVTNPQDAADIAHLKTGQPNQTIGLNVPYPVPTQVQGLEHAHAQEGLIRDEHEVVACQVEIEEGRQIHEHFCGNSAEQVVGEIQGMQVVQLCKGIRTHSTYGVVAQAEDTQV